MRLIVTSDIPSGVRTTLYADWRPFGGLEHTSEVMLKSAEAPSLIQIIGDVSQWLTPFKVAATVFLSQLAKEAATDIYKNKQKIGLALANAASTPLRLVSAALKKAREKSPRRPGLVVGLPLPDECFGIILLLPDASEEEIALRMARFIVRVERIENIIGGEISGGHPPFHNVQVIPLETGGFLVSWIDQNSTVHEHEVS